jgi:hypothetical protein
VHCAGRAAVPESARRGHDADARPGGNTGLTPLREISPEWREEVDDAALRILHLRIALAAERIPRFQVSSSASFREFSVQTVDFLRRFAAEGHRYAVSSGWRRPLRIERPDRGNGIECEPQTSPQRRLNVTMPDRLQLLRELQTARVNSSRPEASSRSKRSSTFSACAPASASTANPSMIAPTCSGG